MWSTRIHRTQWPGATSRSGGSSAEHAGTATGQRPAKRQPAGGSMGLGGSPASRMRRAARSRPPRTVGTADIRRSEEHTSELQSQSNLVCRLLLEKKKKREQRE